MILLDFTQTIIAGLMMQLKMNKGEVSEDMLRHMILNSVRMYQKKYAPEYGEMVLCTDASHTWRKDFYPLYKANRKKTRDDSDLDWSKLFETLQVVKNEIRDNFPYKYMYVEQCEADDIIAVLTRKVKEKILILSGDKDFIQLHNARIKQYNPVLNKFVGQGENPSLYIREHILKGDRSDGIPNVLSDDNVFIEGRRQRPLSKKKIEAWCNEIAPTFTDEEQKNYERNKTLIDLNCVPKELEDKINREFENFEVATRDKILGYFINKKLKTLIEVIDEF